MLCAAAHADTIVLKNGDRIQADSAQERNGRVEYTLGDNTMTIPKSIVVRIEKGPVYGPSPSSVAASAEAPPVHAEMASSGDLVSRVIRNGAIDGSAIKTIEDEGDSLRAAAANSIAANFEEKRLNYSAAARYLQAALVFLPDHGVLLENYASILLKLGQPAEALLRAQQAARVSPQSADAFLLLGYAYYKNDHNREAIAALKKSLQLRPDDKTRDLLERVERESRTEADFRQQESSHFTLRYEGSQTADALRTQVLDALEADYRDLSNDLGSSPRNIYVSLYTDQAFFDVTHAAAWTAALNDGKIRIPISGIKAVTPEMASVLRHELTHSFVAQITHNRAPVWLNEGVAQLEQGSTTGAYRPTAGCALCFRQADTAQPTGRWIPGLQFCGSLCCLCGKPGCGGVHPRDLWTERSGTLIAAPGRRTERGVSAAQHRPCRLCGAGNRDHKLSQEKLWQLGARLLARNA